jgi:hypothetical protein
LMCCSIACGMYGAGMQSWALSLLSAIYNARYAVAYRRAATSESGAASVAM